MSNTVAGSAPKPYATQETVVFTRHVQLPIGSRATNEELHSRVGFAGRFVWNCTLLIEDEVHQVPVVSMGTELQPRGDEMVITGIADNGGTMMIVTGVLTGKQGGWLAFNRPVTDLLAGRD